MVLQKHIQEEKPTIKACPLSMFSIPDKVWKVSWGVYETTDYYIGYLMLIFEVISKRYFPNWSNKSNKILEHHILNFFIS